MLKRSKRLRNKSGVVLLITLIIVLILAVVTGSILFSSLNQSTSTQISVDEIKAEELAKGLMWKKSYDGVFAVSTNEDAEDMDGKTCTPTITTPDPSNPDQKKIIVTCQ